MKVSAINYLVDAGPLIGFLDGDDQGLADATSGSAEKNCGCPLRGPAYRFTMKYRVVLVPSENGFAVSCPALPGCWSQGANEEEALANIRDAMRDYVEVQAELLAREARAAGTPALVRQVELAGA